MKITKLNELTRFIIFCLIPIFIGGIIYLGYRADTLLMFNWLDKFGALEIIYFLRAKLPKSLPKWIIYNFPNGLWAMSFITFIIIITKSNSKLRCFWLFISISIILGFEILQYFRIIHGTFDFLDLATNILFIYIGILLNRQESIYNEKVFKN